MLTRLVFSFFVALENIAADMHKNTVESPEGVPLGTFAVVLLGLIFAGVVCLDISKLYSDLRRMKSNIKYMIRQKRGRVSDSNVNIKEE